MYIIARGAHLFSREFVDATVHLLSAPLGTGMGVVSPHLQHIAILSLGGMARVLNQLNPVLANQVADILESALDYVISGDSASSRLRRASREVLSGTLLHASLLDNIGNSRSPRLFPRLVGHVTRDEESLAIKHAAVKAIGRYETAEVSVCMCICMCGPN